MEITIVQRLLTLHGDLEGHGRRYRETQTVYFDPFGEPIREALLHAKAANEHAVRWHEQAGALSNVHSKRNRQQ